MVYTVLEIANKTRPIFEKYGVKKAILFGSYANGNPDEKSDIDIVVDSNCKGLKFYGLLEEITRKLNKDIDLIEAKQIITNSRIDNEIKKSGMVIYEA